MIELRDELVLVRTEAGDNAARRPRRIASSRARAALLLLDGVLTIGELKRRFGDSLEIEAAMKELVDDGLVADRDTVAASPVAGPRSVAAFPEATSADAGNGPVTEFPAPKSGAVAAGEVPADNRRIEPSLRKDTVFPDEDLPPPTESGSPRIEDPDEPSRIVLAVDRARYHLVRAMRGFGYLLLALFGIALVVLAFRVPEWYRDEIELRAHQVGGAGLRIDALGVGWRRGPVLLLEGVSVANDDSVRIASVGVAPDWYGLVSQGRLATVLNINGLRGRPSALRSLLARLDLSSLGTEKVLFDGLRVELAEGVAPVLTGDADVSGGYLGSLRLRDGSGLVRIQVDGLDGMPLKLSISASNWASPMLEKLKFEQVQMACELQDDRLQLTDLRAAAHGGRYSAVGSLLWNPSPEFDGTLWLDGVQLQRLLLAVMPDAQVEGSVSGRFKLTSSAPTIDELDTRSRMDGNFRVVRGSFGSADLGGVMRERGGGAVQGGRTRFDTAQGRMRTANGRATVDIRQLDAGGLDASGTLVFPLDGSVRGRVLGSVHAGERRLSMPINVSGSVGAPALRLEPEPPSGPTADSGAQAASK